MNRIVVALSVVLPMLASRAALANPPTDHRRIIGILDVKVDGVPPEIATQFQQALEAQVDTKHYFLAPKARMHQLMSSSTKWTEGCVVGPCLKDVKSQANADLVLLAALTGAGTSFGFVVTLVRTDTGRVLAQEAARCDVCTINQALTEATLATVTLLNEVPDTLPDDASQESAAVEVARHPVEQQLARVHHHRNVVATTLLVAGLVAAAAGATVYEAHDQPRYALGAAAAGGGLAVGGVVVLTF